MSCTKRVKAVVSFFRAYPPECGTAMVAFNVARHLSGTKYLIQLNTIGEDESLEKDLTLININGLPKSKVLKGLWLFWCLPRILKKIRALCPSVVIMEGGAWSLYYLLFLYVLRLYSLKAKIVYHAHNVEYVLRKGKNGPVIAWISRWAEGRLIKESDLALAVSEVDSALFGELYGICPDVLPNCADTERFDCIPEEKIKEIKIKYRLTHPLVLFMGLLGFKPNDEALKFLVEEVLPAIILKEPGIKLAVIGGNVREEKPWLINPGLIPYEDVPAFIKAADLCVAPIFSGSGTRLKIVEYLAAGRPVVSTSKGAEGLNIKHGKDIWIADDAETFSEAILKFAGNPDIALQMGKRGQHTVKTLYSWKSVMKRIDDKIESLAVTFKTTSKDSSSQ